MNNYKPEDLETLNDLFEAQRDFADKLEIIVNNADNYIKELEHQKRLLIEVASKLADSDMTLNMFRERRQEFLDLVVKIE